MSSSTRTSSQIAPTNIEVCIIMPMFFGAAGGAAEHEITLLLPRHWRGLSGAQVIDLLTEICGHDTDGSLGARLRRAMGQVGGGLGPSAWDGAPENRTQTIVEAVRYVESRIDHDTRVLSWGRRSVLRALAHSCHCHWFPRV